MKKILVTYIENGIAKKATLSEKNFRTLSMSSSISEVQTYENARLMETGYNTILCSNGSCSNRDLLKD